MRKIEMGWRGAGHVAIESFDALRRRRGQCNRDLANGRQHPRHNARVLLFVCGVELGSSARSFQIACHEGRGEGYCRR